MSSLAASSPHGPDQVTRVLLNEDMKKILFHFCSGLWKPNPSGPGMSLESLPCFRPSTGTGTPETTNKYLLKGSYHQTLILHRLKQTKRDKGGGGNGKLLFNGYRISVLEDERVLGMDVGDHCNNGNLFSAIEPYTLKWLRWLPQSFQEEPTLWTT